MLLELRNKKALRTYRSEGISLVAKRFEISNHDLLKDLAKIVEFLNG
jgi:hypothetical protein